MTYSGHDHFHLDHTDSNNDFFAWYLLGGTYRDRSQTGSELTFLPAYLASMPDLSTKQYLDHWHLIVGALELYTTCDRVQQGGQQSATCVGNEFHDKGTLRSF
jgi:hypothetical protein